MCATRTTCKPNRAETGVEDDENGKLTGDRSRRAAAASACRVRCEGVVLAVGGLGYGPEVLRGPGRITKVCRYVSGPRIDLFVISFFFSILPGTYTLVCVSVRYVAFQPCLGNRGKNGD